METLTINIKTKKELSIIKKLLQAFDIDYENINSEKEITNKKILERIERVNGPFAEENIIEIENLEEFWESLESN